VPTCTGASPPAPAHQRLPTGPCLLQEEHETDVELVKEAQMLRSLRLLRTALVVQDCADALLALHDISGGPLRLLGAGGWGRWCLWRRRCRCSWWC
jgi:hypothetical protein